MEVTLREATEIDLELVMAWRSNPLVYEQMYLQKGTYGGVKFFSTQTVDLFTSAVKNNNGNRRALGFDKPETKEGKPSPACTSASSLSFGHAGFTGTMVWADPKNGLVYVFLSNRVYPDALNNRLAELNIRTNIQEVFYQAIKKAKCFEKKN